MENISIDAKHTVYVGGLDQQVNEDTLMAAFIPFGDVMDVILPHSLSSHQEHRGFAFIQYEDMKDALAAVDNMNMSEIYGKIIKCSMANPATLKQLSVDGTTSATSGLLDKAVWEEEAWLKEYGAQGGNDIPQEKNENE